MKFGLGFSKFTEIFSAGKAGKKMVGQAPVSAPRLLALPVSMIVAGALQCSWPEMTPLPGVPGGAYVLPLTLVGLSGLSLRILSRIQKMEKDYGQRHDKVMVPLHWANVALQLAAVYRIQQAPRQLVPWGPEPREYREKRLERAVELIEKYQLCETDDKDRVEDGEN